MWWAVLVLTSDRNNMMQLFSQIIKLLCFEKYTFNISCNTEYFILLKPVSNIYKKVYILLHPEIETDQLIFVYANKS